MINHGVTINPDVMSLIIGSLQDIYLYLKDFNFISILIRLLLSVLLSSVIGIDRSKIGRAAGLRTHVLVCLGSTIASLTGLYISNITGDFGDVSRISAQVVSGIGFLGAGTILIKNKSIITGLTTSACVWITGTIGIACGYGFYEAAIIGTILAFIFTKKLGNFDRKLHAEAGDDVYYIEIKDVELFDKTIENIKALGVDINNISVFKTKTNFPNAIGVELFVNTDSEFSSNEVMQKIQSLPNVILTINKN